MGGSSNGVIDATEQLSGTHVLRSPPPTLQCNRGATGENGAHSSLAFLRTSRIALRMGGRDPEGAAGRGSSLQTVIPDSMQLTSPERWGSSDSHHVSATVSSDDQQQGRAHKPEEGEAELRQGSSMMRTYRKEYDYSQPNVSLLVGRPRDGTRVHHFQNESSLDNDNNHSPPKVTNIPIPIAQPLQLQQREYSAQQRRADEERRLIATMSLGSQRDIVCKNLPYTWRELVPFSCPVTHPELMSYDPSGYHSLVAKQTRDIGMRMIDLEAGNRHRSLEGLDLNAERGVLGLSLQKHVTALRMRHLSTYPGISKGLAPS
jgi:hypothetical protein